MGFDSDVFDQLTSVTRDATSGILCPANASEWATVLSVAGVTSGGPSLLWGFQDASGNLTDSIDSFTGTLVGTTPTYQQTIAGWSRKGIGGTDGGTGTFSSTAAGLPDLTATSMMTIIYAVCNSAPAAARTITFMGLSLSAVQSISTASNYQVTGASTVVGPSNIIGQVRPFGISYNATTGLEKGWTNQDRLSVAKRAATGKLFRIPMAIAGSTLYAVSFFGAAAEKTDAEVIAIYQTLGWSVAWSPF